MLSIGKWLADNGEAIYDALPYDVWYEGKKKKAGSFNENLKYGKRIIASPIKPARFTYS